MEVRLIIRYIVYFVSLVLLQTLLFNYIPLGIGLVPYIYILAIILLPIEIQNWSLLLISFLLGITIDIFNDSMALHTSAILFVAFVRPAIIQALASDDGYKTGTLPSYKSFKLNRFIFYIFIIVFVHQFIFFSFDIFKFSKIGIIILKTIVNTFYTGIFIIIIHILFFKNKQ